MRRPISVDINKLIGIKVVVSADLSDLFHNRLYMSDL